MPESLKNAGWAGLGIGFYLLLAIAFGFGVVILVWFTEYFSEWLAALNQLTTVALIILLFVSLFPRARKFSGNLIVTCSYAFGLLLWLFCLVVTYEFWGVLGVFIGAVLMGVGIFFTAFVALLIHGDFSSAGIILFSLLIVYGIRILGHWVIEKYRPSVKELGI